MPNERKEQKNKDEIKILETLEQFGRDNIGDIAKKSGFSRQKVRRIIKNLEEKKIIWGYSAISDEKAQQSKHFIVLVKRSNEPFDKPFLQEVFSDKIDNRPAGLVKIENIYLTHGVSDWIFTMYAPDTVSVKKFCQLAFHRFHKYIKDYTITEILFPIRKQGFKNPEIRKLVDFI
ncbi:MAG: Lrp/AsnC family transcriptional regulator [Candidatus Thermoplasmatota archaeon]